MKWTNLGTLVRRSAALAALALASCGVRTNAAIVYVDATDGAAGNTALAAGGTFSGNDPGTGADNLWRKRLNLASHATVFETSGQGTPNENAPRLATTATGVAPGQYKVYAYFWSPGNETADNQQQWLFRASLSNPGGDLPSWSRPYGILTTPITADNIATQVLSTAGFSVAPTTVSEGGRFMYQAYLGNVTSAGTITAYIDDFAGVTSVNNRTWFDGIGYEPVPEPASLALALLAAPVALAARRRMGVR